MSNGTLIPPGSPATTPNAMLGAVIAVYAYLASIFIVQNVQTFAQNATAGAGNEGSGADVSAARFQRSGHQCRPAHSISAEHVEAVDHSKWPAPTEGRHSHRQHQARWWPTAERRV